MDNPQSEMKHCVICNDLCDMEELNSLGVCADCEDNMDRIDLEEQFETAMEA